MNRSTSSRLRLGRLLASVLILCHLAGGSHVYCQSQLPPKSVTITLLYLNDVNQFTPFDQGRRGSLGRVSTLRKEIIKTSPNTIFVHAGNTLGPSPMSAIYKGEQMVDAWNAIGLDIAGVGPRDFDFGVDELLKRVSQSKFRWLAANIVAKDGLPGVTSITVRDFQGIKVALFGLMTPKFSFPKSTDMSVKDPIKAASELVDNLKKVGKVNVVIALTSMSLQEDQELVRQVPDIDVVVGANAVTIVRTVAGRTPIFKTSGNARELGLLNLNVDPQSGKLESIDSRLILVTSLFPEDSQFALVYRKYSTYFSQLSAPLGITLVSLDATRLSNTSSETNVGNLLTDIIRTEAGADVAIINGGAIGVDAKFGPGKLTYGDVIGLLPAGGDLVRIQISGSMLRRLLEDIMGEVETDVSSSRFPQVSGMSFKFDPSRPPNSRVLDMTINKSPLRDTKIYTLVTVSTVFSAGGPYDLLSTLPWQIGKPVVKILIDGLGPGKSVAPAREGRITRLSK